MLFVLFLYIWKSTIHWRILSVWEENVKHLYPRTLHFDFLCRILLKCNFRNAFKKKLCKTTTRFTLYLEIHGILKCPLKKSEKHKVHYCYTFDAHSLWWFQWYTGRYWHNYVYSILIHFACFLCNKRWHLIGVFCSWICIMII